MSSAGGRTRVAMVEDDPDTRERLATSISEQHWLELAAAYADGSATLKGLAVEAPDVLLVDLGLPDMSGLEIVRFTAERYPSCDILVISMFGDEANVISALEAGARGYLLKGSLARDITADISDIRNGGSPLSPIIARQVLRRLQARKSGRIAREIVATEGEVGDDVLSRREIDILNAISRGFSYAETADIISIAVGTVHTHLKRIYQKLAVHSKTEAVFEAGRLGLLP